MKSGPSTMPESGSGLPRVRVPSTAGVLRHARVPPAARGASRKSSRFVDSVGTNSDPGTSKPMAGATAVQMLSEYRFQQWERIRQVTKPLIAAVHGYALGGGCELAMLCDMIVAAENAQFGQPEINIALMPGAGGTQRLTRAIGKYRAMEVILTGRAVPARQVEAWGLITRIVPPELVLEEAKRLARDIASKPAVAVRLAKQAVLRAYDTHLEGGLDYERKCFYLLFATEDRAEGIAAFLEKRPANFKGR